MNSKWICIKFRVSSVREDSRTRWWRDHCQGANGQMNLLPATGQLVLEGSYYMAAECNGMEIDMVITLGWMDWQLDRVDLLEQTVSD